MSGALDKLARAYGIEPMYVSDAGKQHITTGEVQRALLASMGVDAADDRAVASSLARAPANATEPTNDPAQVCFLPNWLKHGRAWGVSCQLYGLRSRRNHGIGDFEDLAQLCEILAATGADFVGTNPLHALFWSDPVRCSPYAPSTRQFLNPLYIAVDRIAGGTEALASVPETILNAVRSAPLVDYINVARIKRVTLEGVFAVQAHTQPDFARFCQQRGRALQSFATFETLSETMTAKGYGSGWHNWPKAYQNSNSREVAEFAHAHAQRVTFHAWLQWIAAQQLAAVQKRAQDSGMRIGLYLDLAVGVAPDGAATWNDPDGIVSGARIGAPPDGFNVNGQDWGLAPISPIILKQRDLEPFVRDIDAVMRFAGAIRIDHAMGLQRLYWITRSGNASCAAYVRYPRELMMQKLAHGSQACRTIVIGEDLGTVPPGFRDCMRAAEIQSYRVLLFERDQHRAFVAPQNYPREAMACVTTHDLPTLRGWWVGRDLQIRQELQLAREEETRRSLHERAEGRTHLLEALTVVAPVDQASLAPDALATLQLPDSVAIGAHVYVARTPSRLMAAQLEDLTGSVDQVNLPGTNTEYPNWRRLLQISLEELGGSLLFRDITAALARERPRSP